MGPQLVWGEHDVGAVGRGRKGAAGLHTGLGICRNEFRGGGCEEES